MRSLRTLAVVGFALALSACSGNSNPLCTTVPVQNVATPQQVGLDKTARAQNVQGAFRVPPEGKAEVTSRKLVLVDDVLTSGATIDASARALLRAGAQSVDVLVFARVVAGNRAPI